MHKLVGILEYVRRRHGISLLAAVFIFVVIVVPRSSFANSGDTAYEAPAKIILNAVWVTEQGVSVNWLEGEAGSNPIKGYNIARSRGNDAFYVVGHVEAGAQTFIDPEGKVGDEYMIQAFDDQSPPALSAPSDVLAASIQSPGDSIAQIVQDPQAFSAEPMPDPSLESDAHNNNDAADPPALETASNQIVGLAKQLSHSLDTHEEVALNGMLGAILKYQRVLLNSSSQLSESQRQSVASICESRASTLEPDVHVLPEQYYFNGLMVLAGCDALGSLGR